MQHAYMLWGRCGTVGWHEELQGSWGQRGNAVGGRQSAVALPDRWDWPPGQEPLSNDR